MGPEVQVPVHVGGLPLDRVWRSVSRNGSTPSSTSTVSIMVGCLGGLGVPLHYSGPVKFGFRHENDVVMNLSHICLLQSLLAISLLLGSN